MRRILFFILCVSFLTSCTETSIRKEITFAELDSIKSLPVSDLESALKTWKYRPVKGDFKNQWQSGLTESLIQFDSKGVMVFITTEWKIFKSIKEDLDDSDYRYLGGLTRRRCENQKI